MNNPKRSSPLQRFVADYLQPIWLKVKVFFYKLSSGDRSWGLMRLILALMILFGLLVLTFLVLDTAKSLAGQVWDALWAWLTRPRKSCQEELAWYCPILGLLQVVFQAIYDWVLYPLWDEIVVQKRYRYLPGPLIVVSFVILQGAKYIQDIYELKDYRTALHYLLVSIFAIGPYPRLRVADGTKQLRPGEQNALDVIGGPGHVFIAPGNVVLFEHLHGPAEVRPAGRHFVSRFERIAEIVPLKEQDRVIDSMKATTRDGIQVLVKNVRYRFRLHPGRRYTGPAGRALQDPYPFSRKAVLNMAYNRNVRADGYQPWERALDLQVDTAITDYIAKSKIDHLISPVLVDKSDPRQKLRDAVYSPATRARFRDLGAELLFCDIGNFEMVRKDIYEQRLASWRLNWAIKADETLMGAEAERLAAQETGRAQAQAEMLMSIARSLQEIGLEGGSRKHLRNIILMQTAQILETLAEQSPPKLPEAHQLPKTAK